MHKHMIPVQTDRQTDTHTHRHTHTQTDTHTHRQTVDPIILSHSVAGINKKLNSHEYLTTVYLINKGHNSHA